MSHEITHRGGGLDEIAEIDERTRRALERRGIIPEHIDADVRAYAECERVIYDARARRGDR